MCTRRRPCKGRPSSGSDDPDFFGNSSVLEDGELVSAFDYDLVNASLDFGFELAGWPINLYADFVQNQDADAAANEGRTRTLSGTPKHFIELQARSLGGPPACGTALLTALTMGALCSQAQAGLSLSRLNQRTNDGEL